MSNLELPGTPSFNVSPESQKLRVLYSFPHKLGAARICTTAWHQVDGIADAGASVTVLTGSICKALRPQIRVSTTLARGRLRLPYRLLGTLRACILHDFIVSRQLPRLASSIDVVHVWPLGGLRTLRVAKQLGIPTFLERPNAHTRFAYAIVEAECNKLGISMPKGHEHDYNPTILEREEAEYALADYLLCPSDFVAKTFTERGFPPQKLLRHQYGFDDRRFCAEQRYRNPNQGLQVLFAGGCAPRKGLHYALSAWVESQASRNGTFLIAGAFIPGYAETLSKLLSHPSVKILGHRHDIPDLMRQSHVLILPSVEEGSALVASEARGSGCVLIVSDASGALCAHNINALVHSVGDVPTITRHIDSLFLDPFLYDKLRRASLSSIGQITWTSAGLSLYNAYRHIRAF